MSVETGGEMSGVMSTPGTPTPDTELLEVGYSAVRPFITSSAELNALLWRVSDAAIRAVLAAVAVDPEAPTAEDSALPRGFHGGLVAYPEGAADSGPGVSSGARLGDQLGAARGHGGHPLLESGEGFEDVIGHDQTVTRVAVSGQVCNHGCMRDEECIIIQNGDRITVEKDNDGHPIIRIENAVWAEEPRFIGIGVVGKHDRAQAINELIRALGEVRDARV